MKHTGLLLLLVACANNVPQDRATGPDGKQKGAVPIVLAQNAGTARGIVTYPGGDRVDWRQLELPQGTTGTLDLQLSWRTPRPGLQVELDVFDEWNKPVAATRTPQRKGGRIRSVKIDDARGKYYVRIYAPKRGDAGKYTLVANFVEKPDDTVDIKKIPIPMPPKLAAVPEPDQTCDPFDTKVKACERVCPEFGAPDKWPGCRDRDAKAAAAEAAKQAALEREQCLKNAPTSIIAQAKHVEVAGDILKVKLSVGTSTQPKLDTTWTSEVLSGLTGSGKPLVGVGARIVGVDKQFTRTEIRLTTDQLAANPWVRLTPPTGACR